MSYMTNEGVSLETLLSVTHTSLRGIEVQIVEEVAANLERKIAGSWADNDDALFGPLTAYVQPAWLLGWPWRAIRMWLARTSHQVAV